MPKHTRRKVLKASAGTAAASGLTGVASATEATTREGHDNRSDEEMQTPDLHVRESPDPNEHVSVTVTDEESGTEVFTYTTETQDEQLATIADIGIDDSGDYKIVATYGDQQIERRLTVFGDGFSAAAGYHVDVSPNDELRVSKRVI
ncbi:MULTISPECIES: hypothetical protein [unclassified Natrinema]|uniref:hypothetical protein n=1 Tax=unclassified Natrinema TaxID=2622230 RepID=UPI0002A7CD7C|nr:MULTISPECIES: hypothetical protein [unclassified Natrinema]AFO56384.2 hypothetical protein NJ7G_1137 [Natrinema sp. J7-2]